MHLYKYSKRKLADNAFDSDEITEPWPREPKLARERSQSGGDAILLPPPAQCYTYNLLLSLGASRIPSIRRWSIIARDCSHPVSAGDGGRP